MQKPPPPTQQQQKQQPDTALARQSTAVTLPGHEALFRFLFRPFYSFLFFSWLFPFTLWALPRSDVEPPAAP